MSKDLIAELEKRHKIDLEMASEIIEEQKEKISKAIKIIENDTDLNSNRQRERLISILKGVDKE